MSEARGVSEPLRIKETKEIVKQHNLYSEFLQGMRYGCHKRNR